MGGRYGGDIKRGGRGSNWSTRRALEAIGREARTPFEVVGKGARRLLPKDKSLITKKPVGVQD